MVLSKTSPPLYIFDDHVDRPVQAVHDQGSFESLMADVDMSAPDPNPHESMEDVIQSLMVAHAVNHHW